MLETIDEMVGEVLAFIDVDPDYFEILLTTKSGRRFRVFHDQDCCELVMIVDTEGNWRKLIGKSLVEVTHEEISSGEPPPGNPDSWTRTNLTFRVDDATVISRWIGESNGYYSESVSIEEITQPESE